MFWAHCFGMFTMIAAHLTVLDPLCFLAFMEVLWKFILNVSTIILKVWIGVINIQQYCILITPSVDVLHVLHPPAAAALQICLPDRV